MLESKHLARAAALAIGLAGAREVRGIEHGSTFSLAF